MKTIKEQILEAHPIGTKLIGQYSGDSATVTARSIRYESERMNVPYSIFDGMEMFDRCFRRA